MTTKVKLSYGRQQKQFRIIHPYFSMLYDAEHGRINLALCGDIMPSRRLAVYREPEFLALREVSRGADACFANLESMVIRYGEGTPAIRKLGKILLDRVARLSEAYGTRVELHDGRGIIRGT